MWRGLWADIPYIGYEKMKNCGPAVVPADLLFQLPEYVKLY